ncbi:hypothetical protein ACTA71_006559 [Dictyostelium dimigraforme]
MENGIIQIDPNCFNEFKKLQEKKYCIMSIFLKLCNNFQILYVEKILSTQTSHDDFLESIPVDEPRIIIKKQPNNKIIFIRWIPEIEKETIENSYCNASSALYELLNGIDTYMEAKDLIELSNI